jgi:Xaa-Pro aminopeptidase
VGVPLEAGNIQSNEPGYYEAGKYGIRIENLVLVVEDAKRSSAGSPWLRFDTLTLCPIDTQLIEPRMLSAAERAWLNDYHAAVQRTLGPELDAAERRWLKQATARL